MKHLASVKSLSQSTFWPCILCFIAFLILTAYAEESLAQVSKPAVTFYAKKQRGVGLVTGDSLFSLNFQFRMQNRALYATKSDTDLAPEAFEFRVRRLRMKFTGFIYSPKLTYYFQLSFSRGDMDWRGYDNSRVNSSPNVVRDAVIYYNPNPHLRLGFGQTKLPGNRQRVISSGDQQFYERSIVNARFNIDRDFGFFAHYTTRYIILRGALTSGEGRNSEISNNGLATTGRIEFLPFGPFTGENDYIEGDLEREKTLKVSLATTYSHNERALRQSGQLGNDLYDSRTMNAFELDLLMKYNGWAWYSEFMNRTTNDPVTVNPSNASQISTVYAGYGLMSQMSYLFKNNFEIAGRYAMTKPSSKLYDNAVAPSLNEKEQENYEIGVTKYFNGHRLKVQGGLMYSKLTDLRADDFYDGYYSMVFQIELGI
ncbi:MAG: porin [Cyclobacteriaceae bacterium]|nr:porin [Cyclobacteriaceae bacterium]